MSKEKKGGLFSGGGMLDMLGSLGQFEEYGKALVEFQREVKESLMRIETNQRAIMSRLCINEIDFETGDEND